MGEDRDDRIGCVDTVFYEGCEFPRLTLSYFEMLLSTDISSSH